MGFPSRDSWWIRRFGALIAGLLATGSAEAGEELWRAIRLRSPSQAGAGLCGGEGMQLARSLTFAPSNPSIAYMGVDTSQVWKSTDGGNSWVPVCTGFRATGAVSVVVDPLNEDVVFATGASSENPNTPSGAQDGIYRTLDGGESWTLIKNTPAGNVDTFEGRHFVFDPSSFDGFQHRTIYAGTHTEGLFKSTDGGETWNGIGLAGEHVRDLELHPGEPNVLYVAVANPQGLYRVTDSGQALPDTQPVGDLPVAPHTIALAAQADQANDVLYAAVGPFEIYKSTDGGNTFAPSNNGLLGGNFWQIDISPADPNYLYARIHLNGIGPFYSHDGGQSWHEPTTLEEGIVGLVPPGVFFGVPTAPHPTDPEIALTHTGGDMIRRTLNGGETWRYSGTGYMGARRSGKWNFISPADPDRWVFFNTDFGPAATQDGGFTWELLPIPFVFDSTTSTAGAMDPTNPDLIIAAIGSNFEGQKIARSTDAGQTWTVANDTADHYFLIDFHPQDPDFVYGQEWVSQNKGLTWEQIHHRVRAIFPGDGDIVYSIDDGGNELWRSDNRGQTWISLGAIPGFDARDIDVDAGDPDRVYFAGDTGFYVFDGATWTETGKSGGIAADAAMGFNDLDVSTVAVDPNVPGTVYAGMWSFRGHRERSIYRSTDGGMTWEDIQNNLGHLYTNVWAIGIDPTTSEVHISTDHGNYVLGQFETACDDGDSTTCQDVCELAVCSGTFVADPPELNDSVQLSRIDGTTTIGWNDPPGAYNVYRGQITTGVPFAYDHTCLNSERPISGSSLADPVQPDSGSAFYYLVTRVDQCRESPLGPASDESPRPNDLPCPDPPPLARPE